MAQIMNIKQIRAQRNPNYFIETVLNDPARLARVKARREEEARKAKETAEREAQAAAEEKRMNEWAVKVSFGMMLFITFAATLIALVN